MHSTKGVSRLTELNRLAVSFVMPVRNDERHLPAAVESVLLQQGIGPIELLLVLGASNDSTDAVAAELAELHPEIRVLPNPGNLSAAAMNIGFRAASSDFVVRTDAHSVLPPTYARDAVSTLLETGAVNVGGRMRAVGTTNFENAVACAYNSRGGLGGAVYHLGGQSGPAESAYLGVFRRDAILAVGGLDETLDRGADWELNLRLRQREMIVWFDSDLEVIYRPRSSLSALARQFWSTGIWRGSLIRRARGRMPFRYFVPSALVVALTVSWIAALVLAASGSQSPWMWAAVALPSVAYSGVVIATMVGARAAGTSAVARLVVVLPVMHLMWGSGCLRGVMPTRSG